MQFQYTEDWELLKVKSRLISIGMVNVSKQTLAVAETENRSLTQVVTPENLFAWPWLFLRLEDRIRVRLITDPTGSSELELICSDAAFEEYEIIDEQGNAVTRATLEEGIIHCPEQMFFNMYTCCANDCKYCPLPIADPRDRDSIARMIETGRSIDTTNLKGIGITSGVPASLTPDELAEEMACAVEALREEWGTGMPIGVSPFACTGESVRRLREAGADEIRINSETFSSELMEALCPQKDIDQILNSLETAVEIFGRNRVSSNIVVGLGETDADIERGVDLLCNLGVVPTLYPLDLIPERFEHLLELSPNRPGRPDAERLLTLAQFHKDSLNKHKLDPTALQTMCPACAASHLMPGVDW